MRLEQELRAGCEALRCRGLADAWLEAEVLLRHILGLTRGELFVEFGREVSPSESCRYRRAVDRRLSGEPVAYIVGHREFFSLDFQVDQRVLIPRPETELLVEKALALAPSGPSVIADIGTGCGAIAVSLAVNLPQAKVYATDISGPALELASLNCRRHGVENRVCLLAGDLLDPLPEPVDMILANLPYVRKSDLPRVNTHGFEPSLALDGGADGLDLIRRMCAGVVGRLVPGGRLLMEIGCDQEDEVRSTLGRHLPGVLVETTTDFSGIPRVITATLGNTSSVPVSLKTGG